MNCPSCGTANDPGHRFCRQCGATLAAAPTCRSCGTMLPPGSKFCTTCGTSVAPSPEVPQGPGYVVDGEWHRAPGEIVRKVPADALRSAFGRLVPGVDWDAFLRGTLAGKVLDALLSRSIRVPMGSVGVVTKDGVVVKILPPGEQTTPGFLRDLVSAADPDQSSASRPADLAGATAGAVERWLGGDRIALYLVDRRPVPVSFAIEQPLVGQGPGAAPGGVGTRTIAATALVSVGADRDALGAFLSDVVGDRDSLATEDLYVRFRAEVERAVHDALRATSTLPAAEKAARDALRARFTARTGLGFDLTLAPRHTVHRLDLVLTTTAAAAAACGQCGASVRSGARFCTSCGAQQQQVVDPGEVLATSDGVRVDLDLVLSVQGEGTPTPPTGLLKSAAMRHLRERTWDQVKGSEGLATLEQALSEAGGEALGALGFRLLDLSVVDLRSQGEQWALGARAAMEQARAEMRAGREWLAVRDDEVALEALGHASALKSERVRRDAVFAARQAALEDARRSAELAAGERGVARQEAEAVHDDTLAADARAHARVAQQVANRADLQRTEAQLGSERARLGADDRAYEEQRRREARLAELAGMAELEEKIADREQRHRIETMNRLAGQSEAQMLAMQASDLADKEHGGAFAEALGKLVDGDAARRERERADQASQQAAKAIAELAKTAIEANAKVAAAKAAAPTVCPTCGTSLAPGARFCGSCGTSLV